MHERGRLGAQVEFELLGQQEVAVQRVVAVDAHTTVQVVRGEEHVLPALRRPVLRGVDLRRRGHAGVEAPRGLPRGELDRFLADVRVRRPLAHRLERGDRTAELLALLHVGRGEVKCGVGDARHDDRHRSLRPLQQPRQPLGTGELGRLGVAQHEAGRRRAEHRVLTFDGDARRRRVDEVDAVDRRHHDRLGVEPRGHADLLTGELAARGCGRRCVHVADRLGERGGDDAGPGGDAVERGRSLRTRRAQARPGP